MKIIHHPKVFQGMLAGSLLQMLAHSLESLKAVSQIIFKYYSAPVAYHIEHRLNQWPNFKSASLFPAYCPFQAFQPLLHSIW